MTWDLLLTDCRAATMAEGYGAIEDAAIAITGDRIAWIGSQADLPKQSAKETISLDGRWVTPGLIDCHTHLVFGGERAGEFEQRLKGATYEEIRSEEHTSELQSRLHLVCRLLLEKK